MGFDKSLKDCLFKGYLKVWHTVLIASKLYRFSHLQDSPDPLANSLLQPQFPGTLVLELDWLPLRSDKNDPLVLCIAGADSSFRLVEVNMYVQTSLLFCLIICFICSPGLKIASFSKN